MDDTGDVSKILVTLDTSRLADRGVDHAAALASRLSAELVLYTAIDAPVTRGLAEFAEVERVTPDRAVATYLGRLAADLTSSGLTARTHEEPSEDAARSIIEFATASGVDLIVMTTHGRSGLERQLLGSVTEEVLRRSPVPVYVVPANG